MPVLIAFREQLYHRHLWRTVIREGGIDFQVCECGEARRRMLDESD